MAKSILPAAEGANPLPSCLESAPVPADREASRETPLADLPTRYSVSFQILPTALPMEDLSGPEAAPRPAPGPERTRAEPMPKRGRGRPKGRRKQSRSERERGRPKGQTLRVSARTIAIMTRLVEAEARFPRWGKMEIRDYIAETLRTYGAEEEKKIQTYIRDYLARKYHTNDTEIARVNSILNKLNREMFIGYDPATRRVVILPWDELLGPGKPGAPRESTLKIKLRRNSGPPPVDNGANTVEIRYGREVVNISRNILDNAHTEN